MSYICICSTGEAITYTNVLGSISLFYSKREDRYCTIYLKRCNCLFVIVIVWVYCTIAFGFTLICTFNFWTALFGLGSLAGVRCPKCAYGPCC